jgi:NhaP-type Na+/H+ or K+/H+ antiporter
MKKNRFKLKHGLIIISIVLAFILFAGATHNEKSYQIGRYRMSVINRGGFSDIFVIDTATGIVKWVGKDEGKPFEEIKGH